MYGGLKKEETRRQCGAQSHASESGKLFRQSSNSSRTASCEGEMGIASVSDDTSNIYIYSRRIRVYIVMSAQFLFGKHHLMMDQLANWIETVISWPQNLLHNHRLASFRNDVDEISTRGQVLAYINIRFQRHTLSGLNDSYKR